MSQNSKRHFGVAATANNIAYVGSMLANHAQMKILSKDAQNNVHAMMAWIGHKAKDVPGFTSPEFARSISEIAKTLKVTLQNLTRQDARADLSAFDALTEIALYGEDDAAKIAIKGLWDAKAIYAVEPKNECDGDRFRRSESIEAIRQSLKKMEKKPNTAALLKAVREESQDPQQGKLVSVETVFGAKAPARPAYRTSQLVAA